MDPVSTILTIVGWLLSALINKGITALLEKWTKRVSLGKEFVTLQIELTNIDATLQTARHYQTENTALLRSLEGLQQLAYKAEDLLDELDYYRIKDDIQSWSKASIAFQKLGPCGGSGGTERDMDTTGVTHISYIGIRHGDVIDALIVRYQGSDGKESIEHWGGQGGQLAEIPLQRNEYIVTVRGHFSHRWQVVRSLNFVTNLHSYGPFGMEEGSSFELPALSGQIIGFHGRFGALIDAIGVYVKIADSTGSSSSSSSGFKLVTCAIRSILKKARCSSTVDVVAQLPSSIPSKINMSNRMKLLVEQLRETGKNVRDALNLGAPVATNRSNRDSRTINNQRETTSHMIEKVFGRDEERDNLINLLEGNETASQTLSVIAIVGHGGVGKTTLAQMVYNEAKLKTHFNLKMWITVSVNFDVKRLTKEILESASPHSNHGSITNLNTLQTTLVESLEEKRFLLVLDDLWEDKDTTTWGKLLAPLRNRSTKGSVVLVTTRKPGVANLDSKIKCISLDGLEKNKYWSLFKAFMFGNENHEGHKSLQLIGREIVKRLKGNPLAAKTVGALLKRNLDEMYWSRVLEWEEWKHQDGVDDIMPALRISYEYLPLHLQRCFSYCALFPKNYYFKMLELPNIWIAQGLIDVEGKRMEEVGKKYLDDLVDSGFIQKINGEYEPWDEYVIHDLLHDLAQDVSVEECLSVDGGEIQVEKCLATRHLSVLTESLYKSDETENRISVRNNFEKELIKVEEHIEPEKLSTIMFFGYEDSIDSKTLERFTSKFKDANALRVLRLHSSPNAQPLLNNFLKFTHLRYLQLCSNYPCGILPIEICRLYHLQVLDVSQWRNLLLLPNSFNNLINLHHFIPYYSYLYSLIAGVGKLAHLQELKEFRVRKEREFAIEQLRELNELRGKLSIHNLENVQTMEEAKDAGLVKKAFIESLYLSWDSRKNSEVCHVDADADVLEGLQPHPNLKKLKITGYCGTASPTWLINKNMLSLFFLESVILENCMTWEILPPLGQLPFLKRLQLISMSAVKEIGPDLYGCGQNMTFQCLEEMILEHMPKLVKWVWNDRCQNLPALSRLHIYNCPELDLPLLNYDSKAEFNEFNKRFPHLVDLQTWPSSEI